ncbi:MAG: hypothetical protein HY390_05205, partial [Deltaproteobacteria bacterium]|nr:hypothetical protein [Deltaproteobacteria bacterium]
MKKFKATWIVFGLLVIFGAAVYFFEVKGGKERQARKEKEEKILPLEENQIESVVLKNVEGTFEAKRVSEGNWELQKPVQAKADAWSFRSVVSTIG